MTDTDRDPHLDSPPADDPHPDSPPDLFPPGRDDPRPDIEQDVEARADAVARGEGGPEPLGIGGEDGAGGVVRDQTTTPQ